MNEAMPSTISGERMARKNSPTSDCGSRWLRSRFTAARAAGPVRAIAAIASSVAASSSSWGTTEPTRPMAPASAAVISRAVNSRNRARATPTIDGQPGGQERVGDAAEQLGGAEAGPVRGDRDVAVQGEDEAAGVAQAVDLGDPELRAALDVAERELVGGVPLGVEALDLAGGAGHVATGAEPLVGAGEAHGVELGLLVGPHRGPLDAPVHVLGERVAPLDPVDAQVQHAAPHLGDEERRPELGRDQVGSRLVLGHQASPYTAAALSCRTLRSTSSGRPPSTRVA